MTKAILSIVLAGLAFGAVGQPSAIPDELPLRVDEASGWKLVVADTESKLVLSGTTAVVPKSTQPRDPDNRVSLNRSAKAAQGDVLTLAWRGSPDAYVPNATLSVEGGQPLNLRPFVEQGTLELDINVGEMASGGLGFGMVCGPNCRRDVNQVMASRALQGQGWQHLAFPLRCFARDDDDFAAVSRPFILEGSGRGEVSVANIRFRRVGKGNIACPDLRTQSVTPVPQSTVRALGWWLDMHESKLQEVRDAKAAGRNPQLVWIGDSITQRWGTVGRKVWDEAFARHNALNLGFGGDRTENVLWRLQHGEVDGIAPKVAVLLIGTNNTGGRLEDPRMTAAGVRRVVQELRERLPATRILLLAIFPRDEQATAFRRQLNDRANGLISGIADGEQVVFLNINDALMSADGSVTRDVMPDLLHLSERGYRLWADAMQPTLSRLMAAPPLAPQQQP